MSDQIAEWGRNRPPLSSLDLKLQLLRDRVTAVAKGLQTGVYVYGAGGIGKSHTVFDQLDLLGATYRLFNSRMTARGLFGAFKAAPDCVHVLEDMERLTCDRDAQGVLRSALWATQGRDRQVTWTTASGEERFTFRGGVVLLANRPLANLPELRALATRIAVYRLEVTDAEMAALLKQLTAGGYRRDGKTLLAPEACAEVADHLLAECRRAGCQLDLRLLFNAYHDYIQWETHHSCCHWHDLVSSRAREAAASFAHDAEPSTAEEKKAQARREVREILKLTDDAREQERLYRERTKKSRADFYRRKREVESGEFDSEAG